MAQPSTPHDSSGLDAAVCRRNALHVLRRAWTTDPSVGFDGGGVRWLDAHIARSRSVLTAEYVDEFIQLMGCFYGECLIAEFDGGWSEANGRIATRMPSLGYTFPFTAVARQLKYGDAASVARAFFTARDYLRGAA